VGGALFWGLFGASSLILGGAIALVFRVSERMLGLIMAFGAGVLISAVAYDLVADAFDTSAGNGSLALGLAAGALTFFAGDTIVDRMGGDNRKSMTRAPSAATGSALAIVLGIVLDGIPESAVIGLGLLSGEGVGVALIAAVFLSNLPEAIAATTGLSRGGWASRKIIGLWVLVTVVSGVMLADTMMPETFEHGGKLVGLLTTLGFGLAFALAMLE
jgi:zinc transporter, ZIP family